jgi:hypothetical protein
MRSPRWRRSAPGDAEPLARPRGSRRRDGESSGPPRFGLRTA